MTIRIVGIQRVILRLIALSAVLVLMTPARSDEVPTIHVEQLCHGIANQSADQIMAEAYPAVTFERCMQAERDDREELQKQWAGFASDDKRHCVAEATMGGSSSYTELLTCLEMARDVKKLQQPLLGDRTKGKKP